jgi:hypothetical protein
MYTGIGSVPYPRFFLTDQDPHYWITDPDPGWLSSSIGDQRHFDADGSPDPYL